MEVGGKVQVMEEGIEDAVFLDDNNLTEDEQMAILVNEEIKRQEKLIYNKFGTTPFLPIGTSQNDNVGSYMVMHGMVVPGGLYVKVFEKLNTLMSVSTDFLLGYTLEEDENDTWKIVKIEK